jgi:hypothetical protein
METEAATTGGGAVVRYRKAPVTGESSAENPLLSLRLYAAITAQDAD